VRGKVVLLTGASRGLGPFVAEVLAGAGADLALVARSAAGLHEVEARIRVHGGRVAVIPADLAREVQRAEVVHRAAAELGPIDVLVNNAGVENEGAFLLQRQEEIREMVEVNLVAPLELAQLVLPSMVDRKSGQIVNIASVAGKAPLPWGAVYAASKAALAHWARSLRLELAGSGIEVSTIYPGYVRRAGMFARFGLEPPRSIGAVEPEAVAAAVLRALTGRRRELIVSARPLRPAFALAELFPGLGDWLMHRLGAVDFQRRKAGG
jgi:short-subunit dehydrogenase